MLHEQMYGLSVGLIIINTKPCDFIDKISTKSQGCFFVPMQLMMAVTALAHVAEGVFFAP